MAIYIVFDVETPNRAKIVFSGTILRTCLHKLKSTQQGL